MEKAKNMPNSNYCLNGMLRLKMKVNVTFIVKKMSKN